MGRRQWQDTAIAVVGGLAALSNGLAWPLFAVLFGEAMDDLGFGLVENKARLALSFVYLAIGCAAASFLQTSCAILLAHRKSARLRSQYLRSVLVQEVAFVGGGPAGLLHELGKETQAVQQALERVPVMVQHMCTVVSGVVVAFVASWEMALVMLAAVPLSVGTIHLLNRTRAGAAARCRAPGERAAHEVHEAVGAISVVKAYNAQQYHAERYAQLAREAQPGAATFVATGVLRGTLDAAGQWINAAVLFIGAVLISNGHRSGGAVAQVILAIRTADFSVQTLADGLQVILSGRQAHRRLQQVIRRRPAIPCDTDEGQVLPPGPRAHRIQFERVCFAYPSRPSAPILRDFDLDVDVPSLGVVGRSGSGKSTVLALIQRFADPTAGCVRVDGVPLPQLNLKWWRSQVGLVLQDATLFAASVADNIRLGRPGASDADVEAAARAAHAHGFISALPRGYRQDVGERGLQLSGGQKQRIALARAILKDPKVLLLDEATSALDTHSELQVQAALEQLSTPGRVMVVVAHRLSTIRGMRRIAVVEAGAVVEQGTHEELMSRGADGAYARLMAMAALQASSAPSEAPAKEAAGDGVASLASGGCSGGTGVTLQSEGSSALAAALTTPGLKEAQQVDLVCAADSDLPVVATLEARTGLDRDPKGSATAALQAGEPEAEKQSEAKKAADGGGDDDEEEGEAVDVPFSRLLPLNRPEWGLGVLGLAACIVQGVRHGAAGIITAFFLASLYTTPQDELREQGSYWGLLLFLAGLSALLATIVQNFTFGLMGARLATRMKNLVFTSVLGKEMGWFDDPRHSSAKLTSTLDSLAHLRGAVADVLGLYLETLCNLAFAVAVAFAFDWQTALLVLGVLPLLVAGTLLFYKAATASAGDVDANATQHAFDAISSVQLVQAFVAQDHVMDRFHELSRTGRQRARRAAVLQGLVQGYAQFAILGAYGLFLWFGAVQLESGRADIESFLASLFVLQWAVIGLGWAQMQFPDVAKAKPVVNSIFRILDHAPESGADLSSAGGGPHVAIQLELKEGKDAAGDAPTPAPEEAACWALADPYAGHAGAASVRLEAVTMSYPMRPTVLALREASMDVPAGSSMALVGESGGGKSSVVRLLLGYYRPAGGRVLVNGVDVRRCDLAALRAGTGYVSQQPLLLTASVLDNICYGAAGVAREEVEKAARAAHIHDFILTLPDGYDTQVHGGLLSGGQKQRIALARAVLRTPRVLLLDEATSALDSASEAAVQAALGELMAARCCTSVVVAHRLATVRHVDAITVMQHGRVTERGTHEELMALPGGTYASMVVKQSQEVNQQDA